jgi:hypothetical protein
MIPVDYVLPETLKINVLVAQQSGISWQQAAWI